MRLTKQKLAILQDIDVALNVQQLSLRIVFKDDTKKLLSLHRILSYDKSTYLIKSIQLVSNLFDDVILETDSVSYLLTRFYVILRIYKYKLSKEPFFDYCGENNISVKSLN